MRFNRHGGERIVVNTRLQRVFILNRGNHIPRLKCNAPFKNLYFPVDVHIAEKSHQILAINAQTIISE